MSTADEEARAERLAEWAESDEFTISSSATVVPADSRDAEELLEGVFGREELGRLRGRPSLSGRVGAGASPKRQVRLPRELDELLVARAAAEHRSPSELMRDAVAEYLSRAS